jgi:hypothetical protein
MSAMETIIIEVIKTSGPWAAVAIGLGFVLWCMLKRSERREDRMAKALDQQNATLVKVIDKLGGLVEQNIAALEAVEEATADCPNKNIAKDETREIPARRHRTPLRLAGGPVLLAAMLLAGCGEHRQAVADSAASIYEAAQAIENGVPPAKPVAAIKAQASAIAAAEGFVYPAPPASKEIAP